MYIKKNCFRYLKKYRLWSSDPDAPKPQHVVACWGFAHGVAL